MSVVATFREMRLSKVVPAHRVTITASWCRREFARYTERWQEIRASVHRPLDNCYWCKRHFDLGEMMGMACFVGKGNKMLCRKCVDLLETSHE